MFYFVFTESLKTKVMKNEMFQSVKQSVKYWWVSLLIGILGVVIGI